MIEVHVTLGSGNLEQEVDRDIAEFEKFFIENVDTSTSRLMGPEKAIIKSYLWYKTHARSPAPTHVQQPPDQEEGAGDTQDDDGSGV
jgi:hypothetical protein